MFALVGGEPGGAWWAEMLLCIAAAYLIARLVHAESIPGVNQFWVTRPYRSWSLLAAKLMFVVVFISLPSGLAQLYIVVQAGFSPGGIATGLLWSQFVTFLALILPMTALAAVTTGIMPFIFVSLVVLAIGFSTQPAVMLLMNRPPAYSAWPVAVEWVREAGIEIVLTASAACVLFIQYKFRRTNASRLVSVAGLAAAAWHYMPWRFGLSVQELLSPSDAVYGTLNVSPDPVMKATQSSAPGRAETRVQVRVPVVVTSEAPIVADAFTATFRAADGRSWSVDGGGVNRTGRGSDTFELTMLMPRSFLAEAGGMDLTAQGSFVTPAAGEYDSAMVR